MITVWWKGRLGNHRAHQQHSAVPLMAFAGNLGELLFRLKDNWKRVKKCEELRGSEKPHWLHGSIYAQQERMTNYTECMTLWKLHNSPWDQELRKVERVVLISKRCPSTPEFPKHILPIAQFTSVIACSSNAAVCLCHTCISISPRTAFLSHTEWQWCWLEMDISTTMLSKYISMFSQLRSTAAFPITLVYYLLPEWWYVYIEWD